MATHLLVLYVTVEQESAIRDLYKQKRWTLMQTDPSVEIKLEKEEIAEPPHKEKNDVKEKPCEENVPMKEQLPVKNTSDTVLASKKNLDLVPRKDEVNNCKSFRLSLEENGKLHPETKEQLDFQNEHSDIQNNTTPKSFPPEFSALETLSKILDTSSMKLASRVKGGLNTYRCPVCSRIFINSSHLSDHIRCHTGERPYRCTTCDKSYAKSSYLKIHMRTHTGEKPHICKFCQKSFSQVSHLNMHLRIHTGEKPHKCPMCEKSFSLPLHLRNHMWMHSAEKPYKCGLCEKTFVDKGKKNMHLKKHKPEDFHSCQSCAIFFDNVNDLNTHMKLHAPLISETEANA